MSVPVLQVGIVGFGALGQFLFQELESDPGFEVVFVWNRSIDKLVKYPAFPPHKILHNLSNFNAFKVDLIIEVSSPEITTQLGNLFLEKCDYMIGSPAALGDRVTEQKILAATNLFNHSIFIPCGAFWGANDVQKMSQSGTLKELKVTMRFHPTSLKTLKEPLKSKNDSVSNQAVTLYEGPVRGVLHLAPNNVNTLATAAIAGSSLGFDQVQGCLISDPADDSHHVIEIEATGPSSGSSKFKVVTTRKSPSGKGAVTSSATFYSFLSSVKKVAQARGVGKGLHVV